MSVPTTVYTLPAILAAAAEKKLLDTFRHAGATSPEAAMPLDERISRAQLKSLLRRGIIVESVPDRYYLDEAGITREQQGHLKAGVAILAILVLLSLAAVLLVSFI